MDLQTADLETTFDFSFEPAPDLDGPGEPHDDSPDVPRTPPGRAQRPRLRLVAASDLDDEAVLLEGLKRGDDAAFAHLVATRGDRLLAVAKRFLSEEEDARDAVQEAFLAAHRAIDRFEGHARISTWLHRVVVNACLMRLRSRRRKPERSLGEADVARLATDDASAADRALESHETSVHVREAISALPEPHRSVLMLRDIEERDTRETAALLGVSQAAVKTRLHRARTALRSTLGAGHGAGGRGVIAQSA